MGDRPGLQELDRKVWGWVGGFEFFAELPADYEIGDHVGFVAKQKVGTGALLIAGRATSGVADVSFELAGGLSSRTWCRGERFVVATRARRVLECVARCPDGSVLSQMEPEGWLAELPEPSVSGTWSFELRADFEVEAEDDDELD